MRLLAPLALALLSTPALADGKKKKAKQPEWRTRPYLQPIGGASSFSDGQTTTSSVYVGGQAGLMYRQVHKPFPRLKGNARLQGAYSFNSNDVRGIDLRIGNFLGPQWKHVGIQTGPDLFRSSYQYGDVTLAPTGGLAWPAIVTGRMKQVSVYGGAEPAWYLGDARPGVDWSKTDSVGLGDEFSWLAGAGLSLGKVRVGIDYRRRTTAFGTDSVIGANVSMNAFSR